MKIFVVLIICVGAILYISFLTGSEEHKNEGKKFFKTFDLRGLETKNKSAYIDYKIASENFFLCIPSNYNGSEAFGLLIFMNSVDQMDIPSGWESVLRERKILYAAPQNVGNNQDIRRRHGAGVLGILKMMQEYKIDPTRVYVAGHSGGARCASHLGFYQSDLISGVISGCGVDFYEPVPRVRATEKDDYGVISATYPEIENAKAKVRFAIITGPGDFRYGNILDIFNGGFSKRDFRAKLFDVPGMGHTFASGESLANALAFIEGQ
jgi:hypothetical protein